MKRKPGEFTEEYLSFKSRKEYEQGSASFKINPKKCALLVIDMVEEFTKPQYSPLWIPDATRQLPKIKQVIDVCRGLGIPIIYTCLGAHSTGLNLNPYWRNGWTSMDRFDDYDGPPLCTKESIDPSIRPGPEDIIIEKHSYGAFMNTSLDYVLRNLGTDTVVICGTMTNYCCGTTAREAHARGYKVVFGSDINSTDDPSLHEAELKTLRRGFALVLSQREILATLKGEGGYAEHAV